MYVIIINHSECDFFPFLTDSTLKQNFFFYFHFLEVYKLKKAEKTSKTDVTNSTTGNLLKD